MRVNVKKCWKGFTSVRSSIIEKILNKDDDLTICHKGKEMFISNQELQMSLHQIHKSKFWSKIDRKWYELYDFKWEVESGL